MSAIILSLITRERYIRYYHRGYFFYYYKTSPIEIRRVPARSRFFGCTKKWRTIIHDDRNLSVCEAYISPRSGKGKRRKGILRRPITPIHPRFRLNARRPAG